MNLDLEKRLDACGVSYERLSKSQKVKLLSRWSKAFSDLAAVARRGEARENIHQDAAAEEEYAGRTLLSCFTELNRGEVLLGTAGKIRSAEQARQCIEAGADFVLPGRAAILHHNLPELVAADPAFEPIANPVSRDHLVAEGLGPKFVDYMASWKGFVAE